MHGLSPINQSLTPKQTVTSKVIASAVVEFPTVVSDLISQMAVADFSLATKTPELSDDGAIIPSEKNQQIIATIELALCSTSADCRPSVKAQIFYNAAEAGQRSGSSQSYLVQIISGMQRRGQKINLDEVELDDLDMRKIGPLELDGMSAQKAIFRNAYLWYLNLHCADLTDTRFIKSSLSFIDLSDADMIGATFRDVEFRFVKANGLTGNQSDILARNRRYPELVTSDRTPYYVERIYLDGYGVDAIPDTNPFTLEAEKSWR